MPQLADRMDIVVVAVGVFALGEALWVAAHLRRRPLQIIPVGRPFMGREDWAPLVEAVAARDRARASRSAPSPPAAPRPRRSCPTCWSGGSPATRRRVRPGRHRGRRRSRGRQQRLGRGHVRPAAGPGPAGDRDGDDHARRAAGLRHPARPAADDGARGPGVDAAREPADRQHAAAGAEPAAGPAVGEAAADPASLPVRRHPVLRRARCLQRQPRGVRPGPAADLRSPRPGHAPLRAAGAAADPGRDPRAAHGDEVPGGAGDLRRCASPGSSTSRSRSSSTS